MGSVGLTAYGVHIHEDLSHYDGSIYNDQYTDDGVECWTSAFQQPCSTTTTSTYIHRQETHQEMRYPNVTSINQSINQNLFSKQ